MKWVIVFLLLFAAILFESTITTLPIVLLVLLCCAVVLRSSAMLIWSFFAGIFLDALKLQSIGGSSLFFLLFLAAAFLYERKFEVQSIPFVLIFSFFGSLFYLLVFGSNAAFFQALQSAVLTAAFFWLWVAGKRLLA